MQPNEIELQEIRRLAEGESPDLADALLSFLKQPDPPPSTPVPEGALTMATFTSRLESAKYDRSREGRRTRARDLWKQMKGQAQPPPPPRLAIADLLVEIYEKGNDAGRAAIIQIVKSEEPFRLGLWGGIKRIYKRAEERHDAAMFGVLAWRFDIEAVRRRRHEVSSRTIHYLRTRAWRYLRHLGASVPELYPQFAVETLRHYKPDTQFHGVWVANHILQHESKAYHAGAFTSAPPEDLVKVRAYGDSWKRNADPLMTLLENCEADPPARFAIQSLRKDFPEKLRTVSPQWLDRLARRPLASAHEFLVDTLLGSPELHQGKLRSLGLHETVLALLDSPSQRARTYAIEYARAHATDLESDRLVELLKRGQADVKAFVVALLQTRGARVIGHVLLGRLLELGGPAQALAAKALDEGFRREDLPREFLIDMIFGGSAQQRWVSEHLKQKYGKGEIGPDFWQAVLDDPRQKTNYQATQLALTALFQFPLVEIGAGWLLDALLRDGWIPSTVSAQLQRAESLPGLDVERVKGLVFMPAHRALALKLLGNPKIVRPRDIGLPWLLALARRADPSLHDFAHRYLLQHLTPAEFAESGDAQAGITRLFALATGEKEPEPVRLFAQTYLRCHHPAIGPEQAESKQLDLKPQVPREAYTAERIWPALNDARADVRKFAVTIARADLRRWGLVQRVYELAESQYKEVRNVAYDALLKAGNEGAPPECTLTLDELDPQAVFALTESRVRSTRDLAMELILRHYDRLGGPERLVWLMQSADRTVRLVAVRMLWAKHRPRHLPPGWKPPQGWPTGAEPAATSAFPDVEALRAFLRRTLFALPPGRSMEPRDEGGPRRHLTAGEAKRNAIEVLRDLAVEDEVFARLVAPLLLEFAGSIALGEWQACLSALMTVRRAHPTVDPEAING
jgi:hypothetical protein